MLPNHFAVATGTGDFAVITPDGNLFAVQQIHIINTGAAYKQIVIRDANGGQALLRVGVVNDTEGLTLHFPAPLVVKGIHCDSQGGADTIFFSVSSRLLVVS